ncbi:sulfotransferase family protein [Microtetraspora sp. NBRC 13810]|uniref:sulfotransferase n=1 Tax=Microtetraspora sp. NBRC 13810 TaxID=3030990 RepID=UPI0024A005DF|nr:sulfotransferase [Microtetraspora sp. NBRC 13810]GLW07299.1 sulfotransferase family protein [Microtetraspora sp. NBRC 13810]
MNPRRPVLVTGLPRSGTSWAGKMLAAGGDLVYVNEPLNPQHPPGRSPGVLNATVTHRFQYICRDNEAAWLPAFADTVALRYRFLAELRRNRSPYDLARLARYGAAFTAGRLRGRRALLDDPFAVLSAGWFAERLGCRVVVLVRDPVSLAASWQRLGWTVYFHELLEQPLLLRDHPEVAETRALVGSQDRLAKVAALWRLTSAITARLADRHPGVLVVRYEDLATAPLAAFRHLYTWAGLPWSARAERRIGLACTGGPPPAAPGGFAWTGLSHTAFRPMDSRVALTPPDLPPEDARRVRALSMS